MTSDWLTEARREYLRQLEHDVLPVMERNLDDIEAGHPTPANQAHIDQLRAWIRDQRVLIPLWRMEHRL